MKKILFLLLGSLLFLGCDDVSDDSFEQESLNQGELLVQDDYSFTEKGQSVVIFFMENDMIPTNHSLFLATPLNGSFDEQSGYLSSEDSTIQEYITYIPNQDFVGQDSIFYEVCNHEGYCQQGYIYIMVYESSDCNLNTIPSVLYTKTLENNTKDVFTIDLTDIVCPLDHFLEDDSSSIQGQLFIVNELSPNKFSIQYKSPEKVYENDVVEELEITFCTGVNDCIVSKVIYTTKPQHISPCDSWEAIDDVYQLDTTSLTVSMNVVTELLANDSFCDELPPQLSITKQPEHGKISYAGELWTYNADFKTNDEFVYQVCNEAGQCTEAKVEILSY